MSNHQEDLTPTRQPGHKKTAYPQGGSSVWKMLLLFSLGVSIALFTVWIRVEIVRLGYEISAANDEHRDLLEAREWLRIRIASLRSPERIEGLARNKLGLIMPERHQVQWLK